MRSEAHQQHNRRTAGYLPGELLLPGYLEEGLSQ
ncbi:MAG: DUF3775 domain-containing protein [Reyranella sp.]|nr:DUF3775 domain-containing protein [Reyranella sp.]MBL6649982.1 DUF3775 domain-containing protein [Reyranella sp.]